MFTMLWVGYFSEPCPAITQMTGYEAGDCLAWEFRTSRDGALQERLGGLVIDDDGRGGIVEIDFHPPGGS
jgi:hypothetical protein